MWYGGVYVKFNYIGSGASILGDRGAIAHPIINSFSYKKSLKQTDSSSCPDCGMDPQDVPHLFNCTAHSTTIIDT